MVYIILFQSFEKDKLFLVNLAKQSKTGITIKSIETVKTNWKIKDGKVINIGSTETSISSDKVTNNNKMMSDEVIVLVDVHAIDELANHVNNDSFDLIANVIESDNLFNSTSLSQEHISNNLVKSPNTLVEENVLYDEPTSVLEDEKISIVTIDANTQTIGKSPMIYK